LLGEIVVFLLSFLLLIKRRALFPSSFVGVWWGLSVLRGFESGLPSIRERKDPKKTNRPSKIMVYKDKYVLTN
jgi:hypothetical protein